MNSKFNGKKFFTKEFEINRKQGFSVPMDAWIKDISIDKISRWNFIRYI